MSCGVGQLGACGTGGAQNRKFVSYRAPNATVHAQKVSHFLQDRRANGDHRLCDIELKLADNLTEYVHSVIVATHSDKLAEIIDKNKPPLSIDLSPFRARSVQRCLEYMYNGETKMCQESMVEHLSVVAFLGMTQLHKDLEKQLAKMIADDPTYLSICLNAAASKRCDVDAAVKQQAVTAVAKKNGVLGTKDIMSLSPSAVCALVSSTHLTTDEKIKAINMAIMWLRNHEHSRYIERVINKAHFSIFTPEENLAFRRDLVKCMNTARDRDLVTVHAIGQGKIQVSRDEKNYLENSAAIISCSAETTGTEQASSRASSSNASMPNKKSVLSDLKSEIDKITDPFTNAVGRGLSNIEKSIDHGLKKIGLGKTGKRTDAQLTKSELDNYRNIQPPKTDSHAAYSKLKNGPRAMSSAELAWIQKIPSDIFNKDYKRQTEASKIRSATFTQPLYRTTSEMEELRQMPDPFARSPNSCSSFAGSIAHCRSNSSLDEIRRIPDVFGRPRSPVSCSGTVPLRRTQSEIEELRAVPDIFASRSCSLGSCPGTMPARRTHSEIEELNKIPDIFASSPRFDQMGHFTQSEIDDIRCLPDVFARNGSRCSLRTRSPRRFTNSEVDSIRRLPDVFGDCARQPYYCSRQSSPGRTLNRRVFTQSEIDDLQKIPQNIFNNFAYTGAEEGSQKCVNREMFTNSEIGDLKRVPQCFPNKHEFEYRPCASRSQMLINGRLFPMSEMEDHRRLPPDEHIFPDRTDALVRRSCGQCPQNANCDPAFPCSTCPRRRSCSVNPLAVASIYSNGSYVCGEPGTDSIEEIARMPDVFAQNQPNMQNNINNMDYMQQMNAQPQMQAQQHPMMMMHGGMVPPPQLQQPVLGHMQRMVPTPYGMVQRPCPPPMNAPTSYPVPSNYCMSRPPSEYAYTFNNGNVQGVMSHYMY